MNTSTPAPPVVAPARPAAAPGGATDFYRTLLGELRAAAATGVQGPSNDNEPRHACA